MTDTKIVGFAGKKQAGKNSAGNFIFGLEMWTILDENQEPLIEWFRINEKGQLIIPVNFNGEVKPGIFDPTSREPQVQLFLADMVWPRVKIYSFADALKETCQNVLGLTTEQCYGNNEAKNSPTKLVWKNMPGFPKTKPAESLKKTGFVLEDDWTPDSFMTARHVLQYVGTEVFRKMYDDVWVDATIRRIKEEGPELAIITDCRFPNEVMGIKATGGHVVRLTRAPFGDTDTHMSEVALDADRFDWSNFDSVVDNATMTIDEQNAVIFNELVRLQVLKPETN